MTPLLLAALLSVGGAPETVPAAPAAESAPAAFVPSVTFHIPSLSCPVCARTVTRVLTADTRVASVSLDVPNRLATAVLADPRTPTDSLTQKIEAAGYVVSVRVETFPFVLRGEARARSNGWESARMALLGLAGVRSVRRDADRVDVEVDAGRLRPEDLAAAVSRAAPGLRLEAAGGEVRTPS